MANAGVSKGSLYDYFDSKERLFFAVFERGQRQVLAASAAQCPSGASAKERIVQFAEAAVAALVDQVDVYPLTFAAWSAAPREGRRRLLEAVRALYAQYRAEAEALLRAAKKSGEIEEGTDTAIVAAAIIGCVDGFMLQYWLDPIFDPKARTRTFLCALFDGIAAKSGR